jgi:hypothetical protein
LLRNECWGRSRFDGSKGGRFLGFRRVNAVNVHNGRGRGLLFLRCGCGGLSDRGFGNVGCGFLVNRSGRCRDRFRDRGRGRGRFPWGLNYRLRSRNWLNGYSWFWNSGGSRGPFDGFDSLAGIVALNGLLLQEAKDVVENEVPIWLFREKESLNKFTPWVAVVGHFTDDLDNDTAVC